MNDRDRAQLRRIYSKFSDAMPEGFSVEPTDDGCVVTSTATVKFHVSELFVLENRHHLNDAAAVITHEGISGLLNQLCEIGESLDGSEIRVYGEVVLNKTDS